MTMQLMAESTKVGDEMPQLQRTVNQEQVAAYAEASGDHNPIHLDPEFAQMVGLPGTIAHGLLEMGIMAEAVSRWAGGYDRLESLSVRFSKPLLMGETITCSGKVVSVDNEKHLAELEVEAQSSRGEKVLTNGRAVVRLGAAAQ